MFTIDFTSRVPIYEQICNNVIRLASAGVFKSGDRLPPVRTVAKEIGVNPNTVAKAYRTLEIDGYIYSTVGRGTFMTDKLTKDTAYRDMALKAFREATKNAELYSVPRQQLIDIIDAIYEGGGKNDMIGDYVVNKVEGDNSRIEIVFVNSVGDKLLYKLSKERVKLSDEAYEVMAIKEMTGYYYERENTNNLVLDYGEEGTVSIQMEAQALEKKDLVWIAKNIVSIYR